MCNCKGHRKLTPRPLKINGQALIHHREQVPNLSQIAIPWYYIELQHIKIRSCQPPDPQSSMLLATSCSFILCGSMLIQLATYSPVTHKATSHARGSLAAPGAHAMPLAGYEYLVLFIHLRWILMWRWSLWMFVWGVGFGLELKCVFWMNC